MQLQTCRRHPASGRFLRTCPGCARELYALQQANLVRGQAVAALAAHGVTGPEVTVLSAARVGDVLIVATCNAASHAAEFGVDVFRTVTDDDLYPDRDGIWRRHPGEWVLIDQAGDDDEAAVPGMLRDVHERNAPIGEGVTLYPAPVDRDCRPAPGLRVTPVQVA